MFFFIIENLNLREKLGINMDQLFIEIACLKQVVLSKEKTNFKTLSAKWLNLFKLNECLNMFKLVSFLFSIPASSAFAERVFSVMNIK